MWWPAVAKAFHFPLSLGNGRSPHGYINQRLQTQFSAPDDERCARSKHVEPSINHGIINSITKLHLVGISTERCVNIAGQFVGSTICLTAQSCPIDLANPENTPFSQPPSPATGTHNLFKTVALLLRQPVFCSLTNKEWGGFGNSEQLFWVSSQINDVSITYITGDNF
jgi:hypothetical protein